jgi:1-aminocyclopropane-1-carboxylate deaminase/D-cysteine desulfhydrase-like pyridoxal-dependent ACC family enzyme
MPPELTPVEEADGLLLKRDDLYRAPGGAPGGKARTCWALAEGAAGLVTAGSRSSPQVNIVAQIGQALGIPVRVHTPSGEPGAEVAAAIAAGAERIEHRAGYNSVIRARAREDAARRPGWAHIPFGMECEEAVEQTRRQAANLPRSARRLVVAVGSGMSLAGIARGVLDAGLLLPIIGIVVGADPAQRLKRYAPRGWQRFVLLQAALERYDQPAPEAELAGVQLDPIYEAKCLPFLQPGDCFWLVGLRQTALEA